MVGGLTFAPAGASQEQPFDDTALVDEYREDVPTATGPKSTAGGGGGGGDSGGGGATPLAPTLVEDLQAAVGKKDAERLEEVATSPEFGAPLHARDEGPLPAGDAPTPFSAAVNALGGEGGGSLLPLLLALVFSTGALFGAALHRRRQRTI